MIFLLTFMPWSLSLCLVFHATNSTCLHAWLCHIRTDNNSMKSACSVGTRNKFLSVLTTTTKHHTTIIVTIISLSLLECYNPDCKAKAIICKWKRIVYNAFWAVIRLFDCSFVNLFLWKVSITTDVMWTCLYQCQPKTAVLCRDLD